MARLLGPDFISIQAHDLDAAKTFYGDVVGLKPAPHSPPGAVVFDTGPVSFAVRTPVAPLQNTDALGEGVALWFGSDDADALHAQLVDHGTPIVFAPKDGPFGRYFAFRDPFGYTITAHTAG
ncbi:VOC family protein [Sphingomonas sp.]|uniref:VOC family protein n=1 Tax=Sphingomonas sp. TaxID=28214 RepID=UPI0028A88155|nr:VOC family protein [Sphingomonas sp.]